MTLFIKNWRTLTIVMIFACLCTGRLHAQNVDQRLWGIWDLETVEITSNNVTQQYPFADLLTNKETLPRNMFTSLAFFANEVAVNRTDIYFIPAHEVNMKGSFSTNNGQLTITIRTEEPRTFDYTIESETLKLKYTELNMQYQLFFKLTSKINQ